MTCDRYDSTILNNFYIELFSADFKDCDSATQNAKTDQIQEVDNFTEWLDCLIDTFVEDTPFSITKIDIIAEVSKHPKFISDLKTEYAELKELCDDDF